MPGARRRHDLHPARFVVTVTEHQLDVSWRGETLAGSMHRPAEWSGSVVLMMQGSGASERDAEGYFAPIRAAFLDRGIATYSFDKPGCGASTGDWRRHALFDRADQAMTALNSLSDHLGIEDTRLGIWGHSQGGWLAQIVAADRPNLAFAIANSGPSIGVAAQDLYGCEHSMRFDGHDEADISRAVARIDAIHAAASRGATYDEVDATLLAPVGGPGAAGYMGFVDDHDWGSIVAFLTEAYDPVRTLERVRCPFLAVFGGLDVLVPGWDGARETGGALRGCPDATVTVYPNGDHRIQVGGPLDFAPGYLDLIGDWAATRVRRGG